MGGKSKKSKRKANRDIEKKEYDSISSTTTKRRDNGDGSDWPAGGSTAKLRSTGMLAMPVADKQVPCATTYGQGRRQTEHTLAGGKRNEHGRRGNSATTDSKPMALLLFSDTRGRRIPLAAPAFGGGTTRGV